MENTNFISLYSNLNQKVFIGLIPELYTLFDTKTVITVDGHPFIARLFCFSYHAGSNRGFLFHKKLQISKCFTEASF